MISVFFPLSLSVMSAVHLDAVFAQIWQLSFDTLEPMTTFASLGFALLDPHEIDVVSVVLADACDYSGIQ